LSYFHINRVGVPSVNPRDNFCIYTQINSKGNRYSGGKKEIFSELLQVGRKRYISSEGKKTQNCTTEEEKTDSAKRLINLHHMPSDSWISAPYKVVCIWIRI
jgi:hypothetical protein